MILVFDTETTGLPQGVPTSPGYPKFVQVAWIFLDWNLETIGEQQLLVDPGVDIPVAAANVHGITNDRALATGTHSKLATKAFLYAASKADIVVGHNVKFDDSIIEHEAWRHGLYESETYRYYKAAPRVDTCSRRMLKIPPKAPEPGKKQSSSDKVKLEEAHAHLTQVTFRAHNGLEDARACANLFKHAVKIGTLNLEYLQKQAAEALAGLEASVAV